MKTLGERVKALRISQNLSMDKLSELISVNSTTISNVEHDKHSPSLETVVALSKFFKVSLDWLVNGDSNTDPSIQEVSKSVVDKMREYLIDFNQMRGA